MRQFLSDASPSGEVRRLMETEEGYDPAVWRALAERFGAQALIVPNEWGGSGPDWPALAVVLEEAGRVLLCAPFLSAAVLAPAAILHSGDDDVGHQLLPAMATGDRIATLAFVGDDGQWDPEGTATVGSRVDGGWRLDGHMSYVLDGLVAEVVLVTARTAAGISLFAVPGDASGVERTPMPTMDQTRKLARIDFSAAPARLLGADGAAGGLLRTVLALAGVALACEQVGGARRCLEMAVDHAGTRHQFGRPIGSFQAVKHACADMLADVEAAAAAADNAVRMASGPPERGTPPSDQLGVAASVAQGFCSDAYFRVAARNIQVHGARGVSWDDDAHLFFKRATSSRLLFGDPSHHRRALARRIGLA